MSNEPTEEQKQAGEQMYAASDYMTSRDFAEILTEREAKLRDELEAAFVASAQEVTGDVIAQMERDRVENATLRARVAELENTNKTLRARVNEIEEMLPPKGRERSGPWANIDNDEDGEA